MRICNQCETEMVSNCKIKISGSMWDIIIKKSKGLFGIGGASENCNAAVCPNCGHVELYVTNGSLFKE